MKLLRKNNLGVTIISLAVTVVVLIILAGITINGLLGDGGIIDTAKEQKDGLELEQEYLANELAEYKSALAQEQGTTQYIPGENDYEQLNKSAFIGMHSSQEPGEESTYTVKSIKTGYVPSGMIVHDSLVSTTSPTIETTGDTGVQIINIKPGYYHKISVNQTNAYNDGYEKAKVGNATAADVLVGKTFTNSTTVGATGTMPNKSGTSTSATVDKSGDNIRMKIPANGYYNTSAYLTSATSNFGDATAAQVLTGKTFTSTAGLKVTGTMKNNGAVTESVAVGGTYTIPAGYHNGSGKVTGPTAGTYSKITLTDSDTGTSVTKTITAGAYNKVVIDASAVYNKGKADATFTFSGDAAVGNVLSGKKFYSNSGTLQTGTMTDKSGTATAATAAWDSTNSRVKMTIPANAYYSTTSTLYSAGTNFGNATAAQVLTGKTFTSSAGLKVSGTMQDIKNAQAYAFTSGGTKMSIATRAAAWKGDLYGSYDSGTSTASNKLDNYIAVYYTGGAGYLSGNTYFATPASNFGTATRAQVLSGKTFTSTAGLATTGTMTDNGAVSGSVGVGGTYTIAAGYHSGSGKVTGPTVGTYSKITLAATDTGTSVTKDITAGAYNKVVIDASKVYSAGVTTGTATGEASINLQYVDTGSITSNAVTISGLTKNQRYMFVLYTASITNNSITSATGITVYSKITTRLGTLSDTLHILMGKATDTSVTINLSDRGGGFKAYNYYKI